MRSTLPTPSYFLVTAWRDVHADGAGVIGDEPAHRRGVEPADPAGPQAEARKGVGHVVLAAADPDFERGGELDPPVPGRREANHALAQGHQIELDRLSADFTFKAMTRMLLRVDS